MKKSCLVISLAILLMVGVSYAAPRENTRDAGKTGFTNIAVVGQDVAGVPGYIEFVTEDVLGKEMRWFMYVTSSGVVYVASSATVTTQSSTKETNWMTGGNPIGTKVGGQ